MIAFREEAEPLRTTRYAQEQRPRERTVRDLLVRFGGQKDRRFFVPFLARFGSIPLGELNRPLVADRYARELYAGRAISTLKRQFYDPLIRAWKRAALAGWCAPTSIVAPKFSHVIQPKWVSPLVFDRLVRHAAPHLVLQLHMLVGTGMRPSEMFNLEWAAVDFENGLIQLSREDRQAKIRPHIRAILERLPCRSAYVILTEDGEPYAQKCGAGGQSKSAVHKMRKLAGYPKFTLTDLEHSFALWHLALHRDWECLKEESGWSNHRLRWCRKISPTVLNSVRSELLLLREKAPKEILSAGLFASGYRSAT
jgi:integrase